MQTSEYKAVEAKNAQMLTTILNVEAKNSWKPLLMTTTANPTGLIIHVILEHVLGQ
jgi:hypothetical protein